MKNFIAMAICLSFSNISFAQTDLSGLSIKRTEPTLNVIKEKFTQFKAALESATLSSSQKTALSDLEKSLQIQVTPATLKRQKSKGPSWKKKAIDYIEDNHYVDENVSYTDEEGDASKECNLDEDGVQELGDYFFSWDSVKKVKGTQVSIAYIVKLIVPIKGRDKDSGKIKWCDHTRSEYAFETKLKNGKPMEITNFR